MKSTKANNTRTSPFGPQTHRNSCEKQSNTLLLMITAEDLLHAKTKYHRRNRHPELQWSSNHSQTEICRHISQPLSSSFLLLLPPVLFFMVLFTLFFSLLCSTAAVLTSLFPKWSKNALKGDECYIYIK